MEPGTFQIPALWRSLAQLFKTSERAVPTCGPRSLPGNVCCPALKPLHSLDPHRTQ